MKNLKKYYQKIMCYDKEMPKLIALVEHFIPKGAAILDVGCGYGKYIDPLSKRGYAVLGVEKNIAIVKENQNKGLNCIDVESFEKHTELFDGIILSHIIEHFTPEALLSFLDFYLSKLKPDGYLIIATPLFSNHFFDDFDHVKPYHAQGIQMVFSGNQAQVQYYSTHKILLRYIWFRKSPLFSAYSPHKHVHSRLTRWVQAYDLLMLLLFIGTQGFLGKKDGWIGVYQKV